MQNKVIRGLLLVSAALALSCGGCDPANGGAGDNNGTGDGTGENNNGTFTAPDGAQCTEATPCGDCDQDCRPAGNPFAPVGQGGDSGFDGDQCTTHADCKGFCGGAGICEGSGTAGFEGDACMTDNDCRGTCGGDATCAGYGDGNGFDGDGCATDADCRGTCGGNAVCTGSGTDPGGDDGSGGGGTGGDGTGGGGSGGDGGTDQTVCLDLDVNLERAIPTVALLIDQSGSMSAGFGNGMNRLEAAYNVLMDPTDGLIKDLEGGFRIGLALYTSYDGGPTCPDLADVRPELNNYDPIDRVFSMAEPIDETPTGEAIEGILRMFDIHPEQGRKIILLATDGEPDTCAEPNPQNGQPESVAAAQMAYAKGVETFVLSVGDEVGRPHLEDMANAGQGLPIGGQQQAAYYESTNADQLKTEMRNIISGASSCIFRVLGGVVDPGLLDRATVTLDGNVLPYGDPNGWIYHQDRKTCEGAKQCVELRGTACETLQDGMNHDVRGDFLCTYYDPENPPSGDGGAGGGDNNGGTGGGGGGDNNGGGGGTGGPGPCVNASGSCEYDGDCCSGICGAGTCVVN